MDPRKKVYNYNEQNQTYNNQIQHPEQINYQNYQNYMNNPNVPKQYFDSGLRVPIPPELFHALNHNNTCITATNGKLLECNKKCEELGIHEFDGGKFDIKSEIERIKKKTEDMVKQISELDVYADWDNDDNYVEPPIIDESFDEDDSDDEDGMNERNYNNDRMNEDNYKDNVNSESDSGEKKELKSDESLSRKYEVNEREKEIDEPMKKKFKSKELSNTLKDIETSDDKITKIIIDKDALRSQDEDDDDNISKHLNDVLFEKDMIDKYNKEVLNNERRRNLETIPTFSKETGDVDISNIKFEADLNQPLTRSKRLLHKNYKDKSFYSKLRHQVCTSIYWLEEDINSKAIEVDLDGDVSYSYFN